MSPAALPPENTPLLEVYYSPTCAPCRIELPAVAEFARQDGTRVRIVIIGDEVRARIELGRISHGLAANTIAETHSTPQATLRDAGDDDGILPYTRVLTPDGHICARWRGQLTVARARALVSACTHVFTSHSSRRS